MGKMVLLQEILTHQNRGGITDKLTHAVKETAERTLVLVTFLIR
jgi:hypothetical protein